MASQLLITLSHDGRSFDLEIRYDGPTLVGDLADALVQQASLAKAPRNPSLAVQRTRETLGRDKRVADADLRSGDRCWLRDLTGPKPRETLKAVAVAQILNGAEKGKSYGLRPGPSDIGRAEVCELKIRDQLASRRHARIHVADDISVHDLGSTNGVLVNGETIAGAVKVAPDDKVSIGDTMLSIRLVESEGDEPTGPTIKFNRPPHVFRPFEGNEVKLPAPPGDPPKNRFSITSALVPLIMVLGMYLYYSQREEQFPMIFLAFMLMSPVMVAGSYFENKIWNRRDHKEQLTEHAVMVGRVVTELDDKRQAETVSRLHENPSVIETIEFVRELSPRLWGRHSDEEEFLTFRAGRAEQESRTKVVVDNGGSRKLRDELKKIPPRYTHIPDLPAVIALHEVGGIGVAGPLEQANALARALLVQLAGLHAPSDVVVAALLGEDEAAAWEWLGWLPHIRSSVSPITASQVGNDAHSCATLLAALLDELERRLALVEEHRSADQTAPALVVLIDEGVPLDRTRMLALLETGPSMGIYFIWVGSARARLPRSCGAVLDLQSRSEDVTLGFRESGAEITNIQIEAITDEDAEHFARSLSPVVEIGGRIGASASVPNKVSLVDLLGGMPILEDPETVIDRWQQGDALHEQGKALRLRAPIGRQADAPISLDIRTDGPHALVAGTTGAGKSELLQSYVASLAATHSARHVTFLLVDYKGGAAFKDCVQLPHTVGLVTDLNTSEVHRALVSLEAELRYREIILNEAGAKDLAELESTANPKTPPTLLVIIDEFAALAKEVPEFIEGVVDVALRGRSLGIHLVLATQRPAGVITPQIRANTSLRIALRVADDDDSVDVIGSREAAALPSEVPGRAIAKIGPRDSALFQSAYVGGFTTADHSGPTVTVQQFAFDRSAPFDTEPARRQNGVRSSVDATDLQRLVGNVQAAHARAGIPDPRLPWQPPMALIYDLARLPRSNTDEKIVLGVVDLPRQQRQSIAHFTPDLDGNIIVLGASGSGKTVLLRTLAASAGMSKSAATTHVYGLDFAGRGLEMLGGLPHVGAIVQGHDNQRVTRLLRDLRSRIDERSEKFAAVRAGSLPEYRASKGGEPDEPRLLVLVDGYAAFHSVYERVEGGKWVDWLTQLAGDGRQFGVHFVLTGDRRSAFPLALTSAVGTRIVLRLAHPDEYSAVGVPLDKVEALSSPGRALFNNFETQIALLGGDPSGDAQTKAMSEVGEFMKARTLSEPQPVRVLPEEVGLESIASSAEGFVFGVRDADLGPAVLQLDTGGFIVTGPSRSGKSSALAAFVDRAPTKVKEVAVVAAQDSHLIATCAFRRGCRVAVGEEEGVELLRSIVANAKPDQLIVIDDLHDFAHTEVDSIAQDILKAARSRQWMVIVSADAEAARRVYDGALKSVRASKAGLLLQPDSEVDGDVVGVRLPRAVNAVWPPGRGYLVTGGTFDLCQVGMVSVAQDENRDSKGAS
ncbi:MAG: FHA domain-containing protein [Acidimicrobiia bacterium]|nr:FHA domain-containing protein [Acidimicrobiia bacterium]MCY4456385.1 FtsK/SpoIIIE domain-containing protein [Acidimicrobiaceae bacterium]